MNEVTLQQLAQEEINSVTRVEALSWLCTILSRVFDYPTKELAAGYTDIQFITIMEQLRSAAFVENRTIPKAALAAQAASQRDEKLRSMQLRAEETRLFLKPHATIRPEAHFWIPREEYLEEALADGYSGALWALYAQSGLKLKQGCDKRCDHISVMLDYLSWLLDKEAEAEHENHAKQATSHRQRRRDFTRKYMVPFTSRFCPALRSNCSNVFLIYWSYLLQAVDIACME